MAVLGPAVELPQKDRLSHTTQAMQDDGLGRAGDLDASEGDVPVVQLAAASYECRRVQTCTRCVRVLARLYADSEGREAAAGRD